MIHPLAGKNETINYINEVHSRIVVIFDGAYKTIADDIGKTSAEMVIVASPADSLPFILKGAYYLKVSKPQYDGRLFQEWKRFIQKGERTTAITVKKDCHELAIISHTGGTTGEPKGVMCSDYNANALMHQIVCNFKYNRQGVSLVVLPPFVNYSLIEAMMAMFAIGYQVALIPNYKPFEFAQYVKKYRPNIILSIPAYWEAILKIDGIERFDMSCFEQIYAGGETISKENEEAINQVLEKCGSKTSLLKGMGSTEMTGGATQTYVNCNIPGSVGIPLVKVDCKIVEPETMEELSYLKEGEICFSGPTLMMGYFNKPEETAAIVKTHTDGCRWLHTGDLGYFDLNGVLYVTGRIKRIFMTKGRDGSTTKIFPDRIEKVLYSEASVDLCCAVGIPDETRINYPKAIIVLKNGVEKSEGTKQKILNTCRSHLPGYMVPDEIEFRDELPRTARGKVDYRALEQEALKKQ